MSLADETRPATVPCAAAPQGAGLYDIPPKDGEKTGQKLVARAGLRGKGVAPCGRMNGRSGHDYLLIDVGGLPDPAQPIPADPGHVHSGGSPDGTTLKLAFGAHASTRTR